MQVNERFLTTQQAAEMVSLSVSTVKRLVESGAIPAVKTPGGHRRITESAILEFAKSKGLTVSDLTASNSPVEHVALEMVTSGQLKAVNESIDYWRSALKSALLQSHLEEARHAVRTVYAIDSNATTLADELIAPVMSRIGHAWQDGRIEIFQEHHACHMLADILYELVRHARSRNKRSDAFSNAPMAIGATPEGDHYTLTGMLCELTLLERGWAVRNLGCHLPLLELTQAVTELQPRLVWLSVHHLQNETTFLTDIRRLVETCRALKTTVVLGGRGLTESIRSELVRLRVPVADDMSLLAELSHSIYPGERRANASSGSIHQDLHNSR